MSYVDFENTSSPLSSKWDALVDNEPILNRKIVWKKISYSYEVSNVLLSTKCIKS